MRSGLIFDAKSQVPNRFLLTNLLAKASRSLHKPGSRIQDTTNYALVRLGRSNPIADVQPGKVPSPPSRRNRRGGEIAYTSRRPAFPREAIRSKTSLEAIRVLGI
jgi:hypothetical protein